MWICALSVCLTLAFSVFWHCLSLKISFMPFSLSVFQDCSPSVSCTSSVCVTFSSFSPLCFLYSMSSPPIWPGSPFYRKNKGVLLQGRVMCLTVFMNHFVPNVSLVPLTSSLFILLASVLLQEGIWFICMLFRWVFPSTKGSYSCTWLAPKGIICVGVYLVCLPWFKKSCFKSETVFLHFFSMWYLDPASLSVVSSLCLIL